SVPYAGAVALEPLVDLRFQGAPQVLVETAGHQQDEQGEGRDRDDPEQAPLAKRSSGEALFALRPRPFRLFVLRRLSECCRSPRHIAPGGVSLARYAPQADDCKRFA